MGYWTQFKNFDPISGSLLPGAPTKLADIVKRARDILSGRTSEQIAFVAENIDWFIEQYFESEQDALIRRILERGSWELGYLHESARNEAGLKELLGYWPSDADDPRPDYPNKENTSELVALTCCIDGYVLGDDSEFPNGQEHEYFAVLALWKVADCLSWLNPSESQKSMTEGLDRLVSEVAKDLGLSSIVLFGGQQRLAVDELTEALEAICWAERLRDVAAMNAAIEKIRRELTEAKEQIDDHANKLAERRVSVAASKAAIKRHAENHAMKAEVWSWCELNLSAYRSMDKAAEAVVMTDKLVPVAVRTARQWIGDWVKLQRPARTL